MINNVTLLGRVGKDPVVKHFENGSAIAEFSMATDDSYKKKDGEKVEQTDWHNVKVSGKLAEVAEKYISKGMLLYVEGKLKTRSYDDKDGNKRYVTEVVVSTFKMLDKRDNTQSTTSASTGDSTPSSGGNNNADDDLPF